MITKIHYLIHNLEDENVCVEATMSNTTKACNTLDIQKNNNPESVYNGLSVERISSLVLSNCQLTDLPQSFYAPNLIELDISHNRLHRVPDWIIQNNLKLQILNISQNFIQTFNLVPKCSKQLRLLDISCNKLKDVPFWLFSSSCPELRSLNISSNPLENYLPLLTGRCLKKLQVLKMDNCNFKLEFVMFIREIPNLEHFSVANEARDEYLNQVQDLPFKLFHCLSTLTELNFSGLGYASLNDEICLLTSLQSLNISYNHVSWLPANFTSLASLKKLNASHNELVSLPVNIGDMSCLQEIYISNNLIGSLPESITKLEQLTVLDCYHNDLNEDVLKIIEQIISLTAIDLEQNAVLVNSDRYLEQRENLRSIVSSAFRENGVKYDVCNSSDEFNDRYSSDSESACEVDLNPVNHVREEENWDGDDDYNVDDNLVLPPYKFQLIPKPKRYDPSDYIDPVCFEDSPDDYT